MEIIAHCIHKSCSHSVGSCTGHVHQEQESWGPSQNSAYLSVPCIAKVRQEDCTVREAQGQGCCAQGEFVSVSQCCVCQAVGSSGREGFGFVFFLARTTSKNVVEYFFWATFPVFLGNIQPCFFCPLMDGIRTIIINLFLLNQLQ